MKKEDIDLKPTETREKLKLPDGNFVFVGPNAVNLENGKSDPKKIIEEMQKYTDKNIFKDISDEQVRPDSREI